MSATRATPAGLDTDSGPSRPSRRERRMRRNSYTPLCKLPPEILGRILRFSQFGARGNHVTNEFRSGSTRWVTKGDHVVHTPWIDFDPSWTRWMLVCRHVREVAVNIPILWTFLFLAHEREYTAMDWWTLCVSRAKKYPLEIVANRVLDHDLDFPWGTGPRDAFLYEHWHRACKIDMALKSGITLYGITLEEPFPHLEYMRVNFHRISLTAEFLGGVSTTLTHLELEMHHTVIERAPRLPALRTLKFKTTGSSGDPINLPQYLATLLAGTPALEALSIRFFSFLPNNLALEGALRAAPAFTLAHLRTLELVGTRPGPCGLLRMLPLPRTSLSVTEMWKIGNDEDIGMPTYLQGFWRAAARQEQLPPAQIGCDARTIEQGASMHFGLGAPFAFDTDATEPRIFFRSPYKPGETIRLPMDRVDALHIMADRFRFRFESLVDIRHRIREVTLQAGPIDETKQILTQLIDWLSPSTVQAGHQLEVLRFVKCTSGFRSKMMFTLCFMDVEDIVQTVVYED